MKPRFAAFLVVLIGLLVLANTSVAQAGWSSINSGYAVTTNYHGLDVPLGEDVIATAGTTDSDVYQVIFIWLNPNEEEIASETKELTWYTTPDVPAIFAQEVLDWAENNPDIDVGCAQSTLESGFIDPIGWFAVKAVFHGPTGPKGQDQDKFKATSLFVIDEIPFGTIVVSLVSFGFLGFYAIKKKRSIPIDALEANI